MEAKKCVVDGSVEKVARVVAMELLRARKQISLQSHDALGESKRSSVRVEALESRQLLAGDFSLGLGMGGIGTDAAYDVATDSAGNIYVTGSFTGTADLDPSAGTKNLTSAGGVDLFVAKYSSSGAIAWARRVGGSGDETPGGIAVDSTGNVYLTGGFTGTADFDPSSTTHNLTSAGSTDIFAWRLTKDGNYSWAHRAGASGADSGRDLAIDTAGNVQITGAFTGNVDFDFGSTTRIQSSLGSTDAFLWTLNSGGAFVNSARFGGAGADVGNAVTTSPATSGETLGAVYVTGSFSGEVRLGDSGVKLTSTGGTDIFVWIHAPSLDNGESNEGGFRRGGRGDDAGTAIAVDGDGNVYLAGTFFGVVDFDPSPATTALTSSGGLDAFVMKLGPTPTGGDPSTVGPLQFARRVGSTGNDTATSIAVDVSGSVYVGGSFQGTVDFDPSAGSTTNRTSAGGWDGFVWKLTDRGNIAYARQFGGTGDDTVAGLAVNNAGDVFSAGAFSGTVDFDPGTGTKNLTSSGSTDAFISKLSSTTFSFGTAIKIGAAGIPNVISMATDAAGNAYLLGDFDGTVDFDPGTGVNELTNTGQDRFIAKYSPQGALVWVRSFSVDEADPGHFTARDIAADSAGNVYVIGDYVTHAQDFYDPEAYLAKFDTNGDFVWIDHRGGDTDARGVAVATDAAGNVYEYRWVDFAGVQRSLEKHNAQGTLIWKYSPTFRVNDIAVDPAGNVLLGGDNGREVGEQPTGGTNAVVAKVTAAGALAFSKQFGGPGNDSVSSIASDRSGNFVLSGTYEGTTDFDPSSGTAMLGQPGSTFVSKLTSAGTFAWVRSGGGNAGAAPRIATDAFGNVYTAGSFVGTVDFDPGSGTSNLTSAGSTDIFVRKLNSSGNLVTAVRIGSSGTDSAAGVAIGASSNYLYAFGTFTGTVDFDPGPAAFNLTTTTRDFLVRFGL